jgi:hypothetical protein
MWPDAPSSSTDTGWTWPGVAQYLSPLAPQLAPRRPASVHPAAPKWGVEWRLSFAGQLRQLGNQARDYPRPKAATPPDRAYLEHGRPRARRRRSPPHVGRAPRGELAAFTARHDEVTPRAGPL